MKYPEPNTKEWNNLVLKRQTELKIAIEKEFIRQSVSNKKSTTKGK